MLVRDVLPHPDDLRVRVETLSDGCPESMLIGLLSLYLPPASIATLGSRVKPCGKEGPYEPPT